MNTNSQVFGKAHLNHAQCKRGILHVALLQLLSGWPLCGVINRERHPTAHERLVMWLEAQVFRAAELKSYSHGEKRTLSAEEHSLAWHWSLLRITPHNRPAHRATL